MRPHFYHEDTESAEEDGARSPLRAAVGRADMASRLESHPPRPYGRGYGAEAKARQGHR
jgi:hypothetical protein